jgi:hypothetical protein
MSDTIPLIPTNRGHIGKEMARYCCTAGSVLSNAPKGHEKIQVALHCRQFEKFDLRHGRN